MSVINHELDCQLRVGSLCDCREGELETLRFYLGAMKAENEIQSRINVNLTTDNRVKDAQIKMLVEVLTPISDLAKTEPAGEGRCIICDEPYFHNSRCYARKAKQALAIIEDLQTEEQTK